MNKAKVRRLGNSLVVTIPASFGIKEGEEFFIIKKENGALALIPMVEDMFAVTEQKEFYLPEVNVDYEPRGGEVDGV